MESLRVVGSSNNTGSWFANEFFAQEWRWILSFLIIFPLFLESLILGITLWKNRSDLRLIQKVLPKLHLLFWKEAKRRLKVTFEDLNMWAILTLVCEVELIGLLFIFASKFFAGVVTFLLITSNCVFIWNWEHIQKDFNPMIMRFDTQFNLGRAFIKSVILLNIIGILVYCTPTISDELVQLTTEGEWPHETGSLVVITLEYLGIGIIHFYQGVDRIQINNLKLLPAAIYHFVIGSMAFYLQLKYKSERLHHDFLGLALQMFTLRPMQILGMLYTLDHILLVESPRRNGFDFADLMVRTRAYVVPLLFLYCGIELLTKAVRYILNNRERFSTEDFIDDQEYSPFIPFSDFSYPEPCLETSSYVPLSSEDIEG